MDPTLAKAAANLKRRARAGHALPAVWLMSDDKRLANPEIAAATLPRGAAVILRHYAAPDRKALAMRLARICRRRGLNLIIAGDWRLAAATGAAGLHLAEHAARARSGCALMVEAQMADAGGTRIHQFAAC